MDMQVRYELRQYALLFIGLLCILTLAFRFQMGTSIECRGSTHRIPEILEHGTVKGLLGVQERGMVIKGLFGETKVGLWQTWSLHSGHPIAEEFYDERGSPVGIWRRWSEARELISATIYLPEGYWNLSFGSTNKFYVHSLGDHETPYLSVEWSADNPGLIRCWTGEVKPISATFKNDLGWIYEDGSEMPLYTAKTINNGQMIWRILLAYEDGSFERRFP